ncbi:LysM peptidoglycan-binding domain-containing protein [Methylobacterium planeticum]|uniref:LysM peptidoglycan-binding domain-containing protein n=1 Tax=Methylobacterium planeticum TaxID=2615211 RepID=A0A6N6MVW0_9HYPH|nr:LysM peptidoglycan-binding domain-containing protein [Methylobacterium planeticum]KAB1073929.1 LysM peptidoglycan-binding domain-containing protein [Methylobacterium planeticum]
MTAELRRSLGLASVGLVGGFLLVVALFGGGEMMKRMAPGGIPHPVAGLPQDPGSASPGGQGSSGAPTERSEAGRQAHAGHDGVLAGPPSAPGAAPAPPAETLPAFDIVRVEPNGETVIAGRAAPNTTVEMLVGDRPVAKALVDPNGQFAIVPPALPTGNSEIVLRTTGSDGRETRSKQSVAVVVARTRDTKPLVALTDPDKPTVVLSQPELAEAARLAEAGPVAHMPPPAAKPAGAKPGPADPVKIVSVDAQDGGRLYVTSQAPPGATLRLYLNDTLVAPGSAGPDGRVTFTIGRGVRAGDYRIRIDQVDSVTGKVRHRAEVPFAFPASAPKVAAREHPEPGPGSNPLVAAMALPGIRPEMPAPTRKAGEPHPGNRHTEAAQPPDAQPPAAQASASPAPAGPTPSPGAAPRDVFVAEVSTARITRGDSLWQISRRTYGKGDRYTVIYDANQGQIRDPDLIYPGQIFVLPADAPAAAERQGGRRG